MEDRPNLAREAFEKTRQERSGGVFPPGGGIAGADRLIGEASSANVGQAMREQTVAEMINQKIWDRQSEIRALERLRESLTVQMLSSGCSMLSGLLK